MSTALNSTPPISRHDISPALGQHSAPPSRGFWTRSLRHLTRSTSGRIGAALVLVVALMAIFAPLIAPHDPYEMTKYRLYGPSWYFPFGTDELGRDVFSRVIYGARVSAQVSVISTGIALVAGGLLGLVSGYLGGWVDLVLSRLLDIVFAFPAILLALVLVAILGPELRNVMLAIGIVYTPSFARVIRGPVLATKNEEFVDAIRVIGASTPRIIFRHVLPNVAAPVIVQTTIALAFAIISEAALSFLGLGAQPPTPSWGAMLQNGRRFLDIAPWIAIFPGIAIMIAVLGFNLFGDWLRDIFDPRSND